MHRGSSSPDHTGGTGLFCVCCRYICGFTCLLMDAASLSACPASTRGSIWSPLKARAAAAEQRAVPPLCCTAPAWKAAGKPWQLKSRDNGAFLSCSRATNPLFKETLKQIERKPECGGLPMISFLILPMQRVTRLPLLLDVSKVTWWHCLAPLKRWPCCTLLQFAEHWEQLKHQTSQGSSRCAGPVSQCH